MRTRTFETDGDIFCLVVDPGIKAELIYYIANFFLGTSYAHDPTATQLGQLAHDCSNGPSSG